MDELAKTYDPKKSEERIYKLWLQSKAFQPKAQNDTPAFSIVIPPPNVTGSLHMGHALNNTIQDILIRRARMRNLPTLWLPGTDHAGIATQNVVEKKLDKEGNNRRDLGREKFVEEVWKWVNEYGDAIISQLKKMGCSCDWSRLRFTLDDDYSKAVNSAFKHYYDKGLIYRGERVINWCVNHQTSLSDIEVEYREVPAKLYYFRYDKNFPITIATTRAETKLGDTAVAVNPKDTRYQKFIGKTFKVNFVGVPLEIKIIADPSIDQKFGTGAVGVTPAHSLIDAELAQNHKLSSITIIDKYGRITANGGQFANLKTIAAREKILEILRRENLIEKEEEIIHNKSVCYRCGREIEPQPSKQWFLKMDELIKPAIKALESNEIKITPARWKKVYLDWMQNIHDWCISRQLWWGHRLPVYAKLEKSEARLQALNPKHETINNNQNSNSFEFRHSNLEFTDYYVGDNPPKGYQQVDDVLDTWFSSALWPFATMMGNQKSKIKNQNEKSKLKNIINIFGEDFAATEDLANYYPTSILSTARDINMLWVVRMIFSGFEFMNQKPFSEVYVHPTVFNKEGKRMSKSLGTGVDPIELIDRYGADAVRFGLSYINTGNQDIKFDENAILAGQKFANKVWNISRFVLLQIQSSPSGMQFEARNPKEIDNLKIKNLKFKITSDSDKQILDKLNGLIKSVNSNLDNFRFGQAAHSLYDFVWHDFADIYIENWKIENSLKIDGCKLEINDCFVLLYVLTSVLRLLHPMMPFVSEEIWQKLFTQGLVKEKMLILAKWPEN